MLRAKYIRPDLECYLTASRCLAELSDCPVHARARVTYLPEAPRPPQTSMRTRYSLMENVQRAVHRDEESYRDSLTRSGKPRKRRP